MQSRKPLILEQQIFHPLIVSLKPLKFVSNTTILNLKINISSRFIERPWDLKMLVATPI